MFIRIIEFLKALVTIFFNDSISKNLEILALRQQLAVFKSQAARPRVTLFDRLFWISLSSFWSGWKSVLIIVKPETVISWHRKGYEIFWKWKSRRKTGRPKIDPAIITLIHQMARENGWGAPQIHGRLLKLGFVISESTVSNYMPKLAPTEKQQQSWRTFLKNHMHNTVSIDFITVPTVTFKSIYCLIFLDHSRRKIIHFKTTFSPNAEWIKQQFRNAFPFEMNYKYLIRDNDKKFGNWTTEFLKSFDLEEVPISYGCPWQNGYCERMIGTLRRELLNRVIILGEGHLNALLASYLEYYHTDRTHLGLAKDTPIPSSVQISPAQQFSILTSPRVGGLYHAYERIAA